MGIFEIDLIEPSLGPISSDDTAVLFSGAPRMGHIPIQATLSINMKTENAERITKTDISSVNWYGWATDLEHRLLSNEDEFYITSPEEQIKILNEYDAICYATN